jgi:predicted patatin/cPLA2 family phospholipase
MPFVNIARHFQECLQFIKECLQMGGRVLVHCFAGVSRSASVVIAYLMREHGQTFVDALNYTRRRRPIVFPNFGFQRQLLDYERALRARDPSHFTPYNLRKPALQRGHSAVLTANSDQRWERPMSTASTLASQSAKRVGSHVPRIKSKQDKVRYLQQMQQMMQAVQKAAAKGPLLNDFSGEKLVEDRPKTPIRP